MKLFFQVFDFDFFLFLDDTLFIQKNDPLRRSQQTSDSLSHR